VNKISPTAIALFTALALTASGFTLYNLNFVVSTIAVAVALYAAVSIVIGTGIDRRRLLSVFAIAAFFIIITELSFAFLQELVALFISLSVLLVIIKYSLIKDHDSGWFGAACAEMLGLIFLLVIELTLAVAQLFC
jgi:hypothetical protein